MVTVVALAVAGAFCWSLVLIFGALARHRPQEAGFGFTVAGAAMFIIVYSDRLPGHFTGARQAFAWLPGVGLADLEFRSSVFILGVIAVLYLYRAVAYHEIYIERDVELDRDGVPDRVDDSFIGVVSYATLVATLVAFLRPVYVLSALGALVLTVLLLAAFFLRIRHIVEGVTAFVRLSVNWLVTTWYSFRYLVGLSISYGSIVGALGDGRADQTARIRARTQRSYESLQQRKAAAAVRRREILARTDAKISILRKGKEK